MKNLMLTKPPRPIPPSSQTLTINNNFFHVFSNNLMVQLCIQENRNHHKYN
jgi:hypothetical protein